MKLQDLPAGAVFFDGVFGQDDDRVLFRKVRDLSGDDSAVVVELVEASTLYIKVGDRFAPFFTDGRSEAVLEPEREVIPVVSMHDVA